MQKITKCICLIVFLFCLSGCFGEDNLSNSNVYTTIYPVDYLTNYLYGTDKNVSSIYPNGANVNNYKLTDKQKEQYSKGSLFIYNGLTNEKEIAREFLNMNKEILLIDVSYGLKYELALEELWLSPNNYLMLAKNIKENLLEYTTSKTSKESIETKYLELEEKLSYMDADLRKIAQEANNDGNPTLVISSDKLQFLENYNFNIINLSSDNLSASSIKSNFKSGHYTDIYLCNTDTKSDLINELVNNYGANIINVNTMTTLTDQNVADNETYITIMNKFIENIRNATLS